MDDKSHPIFSSVVPDQSDRAEFEIFLDPEPDWMSFLLKSDPDYPKRFEHLFFSCENFIDNLRVLMLDDVVYIVL